MYFVRSFVFFFILCHSFLVYAQPANIKFSHLSTDKGLSQSNVNCIIQDSIGFMWFGTQNGLNRYDGYRFVVYRNDPKDSLSLSNNYITSLEMDKAGRIWGGTWGGGLNRLDPERSQFIRYEHDEHRNSFSDDFVSSLFTDHAGNLWIGTESGGLNRMTPQAAFTCYMHHPKKAGGLRDNHVTDVLRLHPDGCADAGDGRAGGDAAHPSPSEVGAASSCVLTGSSAGTAARRRSIVTLISFWRRVSSACRIFSSSVPREG